MTRLTTRIKTDEILHIIKVVTFFQKRFPEKAKNMRLEIECGYFGEWYNRLLSDNPTSYMDAQSLQVWNAMQRGE